MAPREVLFEGLQREELLALPAETVEPLILTGEPIVFRADSALLLASFSVSGDVLGVELAQIEGGGEGVLPALASLVMRYARLRALSEVEWIVHAVSCAQPYLKLRRMLERRGFVIAEIAGVGEAYYLLE